ncbi:hypothetical protein SPRG_08055 [Saprolegnia parasitica CBS 223.65]|uniref:Secreted protein n=1 Tax=Saprolegnia parasitica (strain CBS 223.65) TaxID=695850 RepID=A0A067CJD7_SAPPC|nr:hypothetical protein SPRG_08055 [Saprolegnia parasitica CBS 223.65]KDO26651.1 hypothetical protein SPRG_08055 [Saprolegnia parasitica CBS 223.65]|eukprot:XP_012202788.1 hypothetical protein SPRG_08055 [Saprolegnia parasitica CBS 223.65]
MHRPMSLIDLVALVPYVVEAIACYSAVLPEASAVVQACAFCGSSPFCASSGRSYDAVKRLRIIFRKKRSKLNAFWRC